MDRMSGNGDTSSVNESKVEDPETESNYSTSSKNIEEESWLVPDNFNFSVLVITK